MNGEVLLEYKGEALPWKYFKDLPAERPRVADSKELTSLKTIEARKKPGKRHPWRRLTRGHYRYHQAKQKGVPLDYSS